MTSDPTLKKLFDVWPRLPRLVGAEWQFMLLRLGRLLEAYDGCEDAQRRSALVQRIKEVVCECPASRAAWEGISTDETTIERFEQLLARAASTSPDRPYLHTCLGSEYLRRFVFTGDWAALGLSVSHFRQAANARESTDRQYFFANLGHALVVHFTHFGDARDIDEAITSFRQAISHTPRDSRDLPGLLNNLAVCLRHRSYRIPKAHENDLEEAIRSLKLAIALDSSRNLSRILRLRNLFSCLNLSAKGFQCLEDYRDVVLRDHKTVWDSYLGALKSAAFADEDLFAEGPSVGEKDPRHYLNHPRIDWLIRNLKYPSDLQRDFLDTYSSLMVLDDLEVRTRKRFLNRFSDRIDHEAGYQIILMWPDAFRLDLPGEELMSFNYRNVFEFLHIRNERPRQNVDAEDEYSSDPDAARPCSANLTHHASTQSKQVTRWTDLKAPENVQKDSIFDVLAGLKRSPTQHTSKGLLLPENKPLHVALTATTLQNINPRVQQITVLPNDDSAYARFELRANEAGEHDLTIDYWLDHDIVASHTLSIKATTDTPPKAKTAISKSVGVASTFSDSPKYPDLVIRVTSKRNQLDFTLNFANTGFKHFKGPKLDKKPVEFRQAIMAQIHTHAEGSDDNPQSLLGKLNEIGEELFSRLFPEDFKKDYSNLMRGIKSLYIVSDESYIPWELVKPFSDRDKESDANHDFWCTTFQIGRWLQKEANIPTGKLDVKTAACVVSKSLNQTELAWLRKASDEGKLELKESVPAKAKDVIDYLRGKDPIQLWHFSCNESTTTEALDPKSLHFGNDQQLELKRLQGSAIERLYADRPLIFLNKRQVTSSNNPADIFTWERKLVEECGVGALISPQMDIDDNSASGFATKLYDRLCEVETVCVGEAIRQTRIEMREQFPEDTSWLAYTLYGHPNASITIGKTSQTVNQTPNALLSTPTTKWANQTTSSFSPNKAKEDVVRFTIRCCDTSESANGQINATLVVDDPKAYQNRCEMPALINKPPSNLLKGIKNYFDNTESLDPDDKSFVESELKELGIALFNDTFCENEAKSLLQTHFRDRRSIEFVVQGPSFFQAIPWELLRYNPPNQQGSLRIADDHNIYRHVVRNAVFNPRSCDNHDLQILLLTARLPDDGIPRDIVSQSLGQLPSGKCEITHVRSGSFVELIRHLQKHLQEKLFHVLHFDMHGLVCTPKQLRDKYGSNPDWELDNRYYGFGAIPSDGDAGIGTSTSYLLFNDDGKVVPISAEEIAPKLGQYGVPLIVLNACQSGEVPDQDASLTASLVEWGGFPCVGFQHPLTVACAKEFFALFYSELASSPTERNVLAAFQAGRSKLIESQSRGVLFVQDWFLPVLYAVPGSTTI